MAMNMGREMQWLHPAVCFLALPMLFPSMAACDQSQTFESNGMVRRNSQCGFLATFEARHLEDMLTTSQFSYNVHYHCKWVAQISTLVSEVQQMVLCLWTYSS